jgi:signal transduction histidine kinase
MRTPLGVLEMNLEVLEAKYHDSKPLKRSQAAMKNLISIYDEMEYSLKKEYVTYVRENVNLSHNLQYRIDFFTVFTKLRNIKLDIKIQDNLVVLMNRIELCRFIDNNLSNAIKYSNDGTTISVILKLYDKKNADLKFISYGKPIKNANKIFGRNIRESICCSIKGSGVGLSIVKEICEKYDINIKVESTEDGKNTFEYILPLNDNQHTSPIQQK